MLQNIIYKSINELPEDVVKLMEEHYMDDGTRNCVNVSKIVELYDMVVVDNVIYRRYEENMPVYSGYGWNVDMIIKEGKVLKNRHGFIYRGLNILFLDIDGVLAGEKYLCSGKGFIDPECVAKLNTLSDLNVKIVISSSWGEDGGRTKKTLEDCGLKLPIIGYTEHFHKDWMCRGNEIEKWLQDMYGGMSTKWGKEYNDGKFHYAILDDDSDFLLGQADNFVKVKSYDGLTDEDVKKVREILEN